VNQSVPSAVVPPVVKVVPSPPQWGEVAVTADEHESEAGPAVGGREFEPQEGVGWLLLLVIIVVIIVVIDDNGGGDASVVVIAILIFMLCGREEEAGEKTGGGAGGGRPGQPGRRVQHSILVCIAPFRQSDSGGVNDDDREQGRRERQCTL